MAVFGAPGSADSDAPQVVIEAWNKLIIDQIGSRPPSPILVVDAAEIPNGQISSAVSWPGHPLEPLNCQDEEVAAELCDWGWAGRAELHNEYLEYGLVMRSDAAGRLRPKRFVATTELMEWWQVMAVHAPEYFVSRVNGITGRTESFKGIFGRTVSQWEQLSTFQRAGEFSRVMVGMGRSVPPSSSLNPDHVLFMSHPINGLDDLIYVVHFGSFPYAVKNGDEVRRTRIEEIFAAEGVRYLFCRNADPAAAEGAYNQAFMVGTEGAPQYRKLAFANPLGMYIRSFSSDDLFFQGDVVPTRWTRLSRGAKTMPQRLEFGPDDNEDGFLDEVTLGQDVDSPPLSGYQVAKRIEVGPLVVVGDAAPIHEQDFKIISATPIGSIACGTAQDARCRDIEILKREYDSRTVSARTGMRGGAVG